MKTQHSVPQGSIPLTCGVITNNQSIHGLLDGLWSGSGGDTIMELTVVQEKNMT